MAKILVVSLIHNKKRFLSDCVLSVVNQTIPKSQYLHLLIDNASTDGADKLCELFAKKYAHIRFCRMKSNIGQMPAYNWVLNRWLMDNCSDADIMCQVDADDLITPIALKEVVCKFDSNKEIGHTYSDFNIINAGGAVKIYSHPKAKQVDPKIELTDKGQRTMRVWELKFNIIGHLRAMRISALKEIGGFDETYRFATDFSMAAKMLSSRFKVAKIPKTLYCWREHGLGQVQSVDSKQQTEDWKNLVELYSKKWKIDGLI